MEHGSLRCSRSRVATRSCAAVSLVALLLVVAPPAAPAATIMVTTTADNTTADGQCTLREAIQSANDDASPNPGDCTDGSGVDEIQVPAGTYTLTTGSALVITSSMRIVGADPGTNLLTTRVESTGTDRVFDISAAMPIDVTLELLRIQGGKNVGQGGGVRVNLPGGSVTVVQCEITNNEADNGGGMWIGMSTGTAEVTIRESALTENRAKGQAGPAGLQDGGGLYHGSAGPVTVVNTTFSNNVADDHGGGISHEGSGTLFLNNVTIAHNQADGDGGGAGDGGGIYRGLTTGTATIANTIIADNTDGGVNVHPDCSGTFASGNSNLIENTAGCSGFTGNADHFGFAINLAPLGDYGGPTRSVGPNSVADKPPVDNGNQGSPTTACEATDQRGVPRPQGSACDIGALELAQCGDGILCNVDGCIPQEQCDDGNTVNGDCCSATCQFESAGSSCDDGLFCTATDTCDGAGSCVGSGDPCPGPDGDGDCAESCDETTDSCTANDPSGSACDDGLFCNGTDTCDGSGACSVHAGDPCAGGGQCNDTCNEAADNCFSPSGTACDDGLFCTATDTCNGAGSCVGSGDPCPGPDGDGDCSESCDETSDSCTANDPAGSACDDGLFCTATDTCDGAGSCVGSGDPCPGPDGDGDCAESCDEATDSCTANDPSGSSCDDGLFCTATDTCDGAGSCVGSGDPCPGPDGDGDCAESCDETTDSCTANDPSGSACDDGQFCNGTDTCDGSGACSVHAGDPCAGGGQCNDMCNEAADNCFSPSGTACDDGLFCTATDTCDGAGTCSGTGDPCPGPDGDGNCAESCDEASDSCTANDPAGSACDDGLFCTATDTCDGAGTCSGTGDPCAGGPECNNGTCDEAGDNCFNPAGTPCSDEGDVCTVDECDGAGTCAHTFIDSDSDGVCDLVEDGAPNGGDGNGDGTLDSLQDSVTSLPNAVDGSYMTFVTNPCAHANVQAVDPASLNAEGYRLPFGALSFELPGCGSTHVTIYYHNISNLPQPPYRYLKRGPNPPGSATDMIYFLEEGLPNNVTFGSATLYGVPVGMVQFDLADGQLGDDTGSDGSIVDQGGPALQEPTPTPATTPVGLAGALLVLIGLAVRRLRGWRAAP